MTDISRAPRLYSNRHTGSGYVSVRAMEFLNALLRTYHRLDSMNDCPGGECYEDGKQYTISHEVAARLFVITPA
jgi:hypothetical protein